MPAAAGGPFERGTRDIQSTSRVPARPAGRVIRPAALPTEIRWTVPLPDAPFAEAVMTGGRVFVALRSGGIVAHSSADGLELWRAAFTAEQPLAALNGLLLVAAGEAVHALRVADGTVAWRAESGALTASLLAQDGWVIASSGTRLMALRGADGTIIWERDITGRIVQPSVEGDRLYLPFADGRVQSLVLGTGLERWTRRLGGAPAEVLAFSERVFVGSADRHLYALDAVTGSIAWRFRIGAAIRGRPASEGLLVFVGALDNLVRAFHFENGARRWDGPLPYRPTAGPLVVGGSVITSGPARELPTFDVSTGAAKAKLTLPAVLAAPLTLATADEAPVLVALTGDATVGWALSLLDPPFGPRVVPLTALPGEVVPIQVPRIPPPPK